MNHLTINRFSVEVTVRLIVGGSLPRVALLSTPTWSGATAYCATVEQLGGRPPSLSAEKTNFSIHFQL